MKRLSDHDVLPNLLFVPTGEPPLVDITGPNEVEAGKNVTLRCEPVAGDPIPEVEFKPKGGTTFPRGYRLEKVGDTILLHVVGVTESFCVDCFGNNLEGETEDSQCVNVLRKLKMVKVKSVYHDIMTFLDQTFARHISKLGLEP